MTRYLIGDLRSGGSLHVLPVMTGPWSDRLDTAETVQVKVDMNDLDVQALDLWNTAIPCKSFLVVQEGNQLQGGPLWTAKYDDDARTMELGASGMASYFDQRPILPLLAASIGVDQWTIPDPTDATKTIPNPDLTTSYAGIWLGTIAKRLVQQAQAWTGGNVPLVFQSDETDGDATHDRNYLGANFKPVGEALNDLVNVQGGPEINFQPRLTQDKLSVEWVMQVGTVEQPLLFGPNVVEWNATVPESPLSGLTINRDGSKMASRSWATGGSQANTVLVSRAYDPTLVDAGFPLLEVVDSSHTTVSLQPTLDSIAQSLVVQGRQPTETWSFKVAAYPRDERGNAAGPQADQYSTGDFCTLIFAPFDPQHGVGNPLLKSGGTFQHRIVGRSGAESGTTITIDCAPVLGGI